MSELYEQIMSQKGSLENLAMKIPGFRGYQESAARRKADTMLRDHLAGEVEKVRAKFERVEKAILDAGGLKRMSKTREIKGKIQLYADKIKSETPGYAGLWAQMKIGAKELEELYAFDEAQIRCIEKPSAQVDALQNAAVAGGKKLTKALGEMDSAAVEALDAFGQRDDVLTRIAELL